MVFPACRSGTPRKHVISGWPSGGAIQSGCDAGLLRSKGRPLSSTRPRTPRISNPFNSVEAFSGSILQASHPVSLIARLSKSPSSFISLMNPNLLPVSRSASERQSKDKSLSSSHVIASMSTLFTARCISRCRPASSSDFLRPVMSRNMAMMMSAPSISSVAVFISAKNIVPSLRMQGMFSAIHVLFVTSILNWFITSGRSRSAWMSSTLRAINSS